MYICWTIKCTCDGPKYESQYMYRVSLLRGERVEFNENVDCKRILLF